MKKVLLIGDSISLYYSPFLASCILGKAELHNKEGRREAFTDLDKPIGGNGGDSSMVLDYLKKRSAENSLDYDLFIFNCGLHDIKRLDDGECVISEEDYKRNLSEILSLSAKHNIKTLFITTTHVEDERHNARKQLGFTRYNRDVKRYNQIALSVMNEKQIPVIDLFAFTNKLNGEIFIDHVHFSEEVRKKQAEFIADVISQYLD